MSSSKRFLAGAACVLLAWPAPVCAQDDAPGAAPSVAARPTEPSAESAPAPASEPPPPIYEAQMLRLSEILGSLAFLRDLCGGGDGAAWRDEMSALLEAEHPGPQRKARLVGRFNHGFETFNAVYRSCTPSARLAISRYLLEGQALSSTVRSRYSQ